MLFKALMRPIANAVCRVPVRNTSAVVGAKSRHVSNVVSIISSAKKSYSIVFGINKTSGAIPLGIRCFHHIWFCLKAVNFERNIELWFFSSIS